MKRRCSFPGCAPFARASEGRRFRPGSACTLEAKAAEIHAIRIVLDGIDVLLALLDDPVAERRQISQISELLLKGRLPEYTQRVGGNDNDNRYSFLQFMVDCAIMFRHQAVNGSAFRNLRVSFSAGGSDFSGDEFPTSLAVQGLQPSNRGPTEPKYEVTYERMPCGFPRLDKMLRGGHN